MAPAPPGLRQARPERAETESARPEPVDGPARRGSLRAQRLTALALLATLLLVLPPLMPWLHGAPLWGWPRWAWALFGLWAALIAAVALLLERGNDDEAA